MVRGVELQRLLNSARLCTSGRALPLDRTLGYHHALPLSLAASDAGELARRGFPQPVPSLSLDRLHCRAIPFAQSCCFTASVVKGFADPSLDCASSLCCPVERGPLPWFCLLWNFDFTRRISKIDSRIGNCPRCCSFTVFFFPLVCYRCTHAQWEMSTNKESR